MTTGGPYFMPGLAERYELVQSGRAPSSPVTELPVRLDTVKRGAEIIALKYRCIRKSEFDRFVDA